MLDMRNRKRFVSFCFCDTAICKLSHRSRTRGICLMMLLAFCPTTFLFAQNLPDAPQSQVSGQQDQDKAPKKTSDSSEQSGSETADQKQTTAAPQANTPAVGTQQADSSDQSNANQSQAKQTKRMMWVVPNFGAVSSDTQLPPLSTREKFKLAESDSFDYSAFIWTGILAFQSWGLDSDPELGRGAAGYGRYYWRGFADGVSGTYFTEAIIPAITHEDPRYYTLGHGGFFRRTKYALSRTFITKTDSGGTSFSWSEVGGNGLEAGLANAYYPPEEQGLNQTLRNWGTQMESAALNNVAKEFWPDIRRKLLRQK